MCDTEQTEGGKDYSLVEILIKGKQKFYSFILGYLSL